MAQIKTFAQACKIAKVDSKKLPDVSMLPKKHQKSFIAYFKLIIIAQAINEGWEPDWNNSNEYKYTPWFEVKADKKRPAGFGFSAAGYGTWRTFTAVGSRLCFKSRELALYAGKTFTDIYIDYLLIP